MFGKHVAENACSVCGSVACLQLSPRFCRHLRQLRQAEKAMDAPPADKMMREPVAKK
jgi:hypothetical protein